MTAVFARTLWKYAITDRWPLACMAWRWKPAKNRWILRDH